MPQTVTVTLTIPDADARRLQAAVAATGQTPKALIVAYLQSLVPSYELQQHEQQYAAGYTPIVAA